MIVNAEFLLDEIRLRFNEFFVEKGGFNVPGVKILWISVKAMLVSEEDLRRVRDSFTRVPPAKPSTRKRTSAAEVSPAKPAGVPKAKRSATEKSKPKPKSEAET